MQHGCKRSSSIYTHLWPSLVVPQPRRILQKQKKIKIRKSNKQSMETMFQTNKSYKQPTETMVHPSLGEIKIE